jgi:glycerol kinase
VRGAGLGRVRGVPHGELGHHGQRVGPGARATGALAGRRGGHPGANEGWLLEGGLSAAGSFLAWLGRLLDRPVDELAARAAKSPPGARGVIAVPWLDGARAPWWRDDARAGFVGLGAAHGMDDLSRAVIESVAWDVLRCMEVVTAGRLGGSTAQGSRWAGPAPGSRCGSRC